MSSKDRKSIVGQKQISDIETDISEIRFSSLFLAAVETLNPLNLRSKTRVSRDIDVSTSRFHGLRLSTPRRSFPVDCSVDIIENKCYVPRNRTTFVLSRNVYLNFYDVPGYFRFHRNGVPGWDALATRRCIIDIFYTSIVSAGYTRVYMCMCVCAKP